MITGRPLFTTEQIHDKVVELAGAIYRDYEGKEVLAIGILKGAFIFFADIIRALKLPVTVDFIVASSYFKTASKGKTTVYYEPREPVQGKNVLLIDDIIDTGVSLNSIREKILSQKPASLKICVLLDKKERRIADVPIDYTGFNIPNQFVVGYGLDYENKYRNLPYIAVFKKET
ncbi:MAG TPA: hypoxanthine phosphoribosyltransferase [Dissulfurispiraceae bacterium]|nr:hypoxanthine phosphoribosyltransferase [Dissulfurispiraceae bacterium]